MTAPFAMILNVFRRPAAVAMAAAALVVLPGAVQARGPEKIADVAETVIDAVVNISTSQRVESRVTPPNNRRPPEQGPGQTPQVPPGSPFEDFFKDFFENRRGPGGPGAGGGGQSFQFLQRLLAEHAGHLGKLHPHQDRPLAGDAVGTM